MADASIEYDKVYVVASHLNRVATETVPILASLQNQVNGLLDPSGGLWLNQSSPVLNDKYQAFNTSVTQAVNQIPSWAMQFNNIVSSMKALDQAIADSTK
jgi:hypothetical protein